MGEYGIAISFTVTLFIGDFRYLNALSDKAFKYLKSPIKRVTVKDVAIPYSPILESHVIPEVADIVNCIEELLELN